MKKRVASSKPVQSKPSAEERTIPIPEVASGNCSECGVAYDLDQATTKPDGKKECHECGAPFDPKLAALKPADASGAKSEERPKRDPEKLPKAYCNECGAEWVRLEIGDHKPFPNCGHTDGFVNDPVKARNYGPPAGHPYDPKAHAEILAKRAQMANAGQETAKADDRTTTDEGLLGRPSKPGSMASTTVNAPSITVSVHPGYIRGEWGKSMFRLGDFATFTIGEFSISEPYDADKGPGEVARIKKSVLASLEAWADEAFETQSRWYLAKCDMLDAAIEAWEKRKKK